MPSSTIGGDSITHDVAVHRAGGTMIPCSPGSWRRNHDRSPSSSSSRSAHVSDPRLEEEPTRHRRYPTPACTANTLGRP